jgi:hypothetical protein
MTLDRSNGDPRKLPLFRALSCGGLWVALSGLLAVGCLVPDAPAPLLDESPGEPRQAGDYWTEVYYPFEEFVDQFPAGDLEGQEEYWAEGPTLFYLPHLPEGQTAALSAAVEGSADVWLWEGDGWTYFEGELQYSAVEYAPILGVVPYGDIGAAISFAFDFLTQDCEETWKCQLTTSQYYGFANYCWYTCIFQSDLPAGCSGLAPGVTVGGHEEWSWNQCSPTLTVTKG